MLVGPSPRYIDDDGYVGGFAQADIEELLDSLDSNFLGWSSAMAPAIMGNPDRPELGEELTESFCRTDPDIAARFARVTFLSDNRADLATVDVPTLVLQCSEDVIAPDAVGEYVHRADPGLGARADRGDRPLPEPERARRRRSTRSGRSSDVGVSTERRGPVRERAVRIPVDDAGRDASCASTRPSCAGRATRVRSWSAPSASRTC